MDVAGSFASTRWLSMPVTGLKLEQFNETKSLVLSGQGPYLVAHLRSVDFTAHPEAVDSVNREEAARELILPNAYTVHGIESWRVTESSTHAFWLALVWGAKAVRLVRITASREQLPSSEWTVRIQPGELKQIDDWIFQIRFCDRTFQAEAAPEQHTLSAAVVTAHNAVRQVTVPVDPTGRQPLSFAIAKIKPGSRCLLYSADIRWISPSSTLVISGTCYGEICVWICAMQPSGLDGPIPDDPFRSRHLSVVELLPGHEGSVFGLSVSTPADRNGHLGGSRVFVFSCSDDRMIHAWDVSLDSGTEKAVSDVEEYLGNRDTGFGTRAGADRVDVEPLATAWALQSRVWLVQNRMLEYQTDGAGAPVRVLAVISGGEDATVRVWQLDTEHQKDPSSPPKASLLERYTGKHHIGKHVWAMDHLVHGSDLFIVSAGADGKIVGHSVIHTLDVAGVDKLQHDATDEVQCDWSIDEVIAQATPDSEPAKPKDAFRAFDLVRPDSLVLSTNAGRVLLGRLEAASQPGWSWTQLAQVDSLRGFSVVRACPEADIAFVAGLKNVLFAVRLSGSTGGATVQEVNIQPADADSTAAATAAATQDKISDILVSTFEQSPLSAEAKARPARFTAVYISYTQSKPARVILFRLSADGELSTALTSISLLPAKDVASLNSKTKNAVTTAFTAVHHESDRFPSSLLFFLGTRSGVTQYYTVNLDLFPTEPTDDGPAAGRLNHVATVSPFAFSLNHHSEAVTRLLWKPSESPAGAATIGWLFSTDRAGYLSVESVNCVEQTAGAGASPAATVTLVHSLRLPVGPYVEGVEEVPAAAPDGPSLAVFGFRKTRFVLYDVLRERDLFSVECGGAHRPWALRGPRPGAAGRQRWSVAWTQSKRLHWWSPSARAGPAARVDLLQEGNHGREIKAGASVCVLGSDTALVATGSEDTDIKIFSVGPPARPGGGPVVRCASTLRQHTTGLQALAWAEPERDRPQYLFSSGGVEELCVWKINPGVPFIQTGVLLVGVLPPLNPDEPCDIRFMGVAAFRKRDGPLERDSFEVIVSTSDSKLHFLDFDPSAEGSRQWHRRFTVHYLSCSLFGVASPGIFNGDFERTVFTTGTDGYLLALYPGSRSKVKNNRLMIDEDVYSIRDRERHKIHQSAILDFDTINLPFDHHLLVSGGDDNAFVITLLSRPKETSTLPIHERDLQRQRMVQHTHRASVVIPQSHSACIKAVSIVSSTTRAERTGQADQEIIALSAGNDQVLSLWKINVTVLSGAKVVKPEQIEVERVSKEWTPIADVSSLQRLPRSTVDGVEQENILIAGVGMEVVSFALPTSPSSEQIL